MSNFFTPEFNNESAIAPWNASLEPTKAIIPQLDANRVLTGGVGQEVNMPTLTPEAYDNIILPDASLTRMASAVSTESNSSLPDSSVDLLTGQAMSEVYGDLSKFAADPDFAAKLNVPFGENWDAAGAKALAEAWFQGDFSDIPPVKVVSSAEIGGANGAFAAATDTIYLSKEFLAGNAANPAAIADVLLEEIGHSVDSRLNVTDSPGDEGAIFGAVVQGKELSLEILTKLKLENDQVAVTIDGESLIIENNIGIGINQILSSSLSTTDPTNPTRGIGGYYKDDYSFTGITAGQSVKVNLNSSAFDAYLQIINQSTGTVITENDDANGTNNSEVTFNPQSGVNYLARVTSYSAGATGAYSIVTSSNLTKPTVSLSVTDSSVAETTSGQTANPGQFTVARTGGTTNPLTVYYTTGGTATKGTDYQNLLGSVTIPAGSTTATIPINVIDDGLVEGSETAIINLSANTNYNSGTGGNNIDFGDTSGTVTIADNDVVTKPTVSLTTTDSSAAETTSGQTANPGQFTFTRTGTTTNPLTVYYTTGGTAIKGTDYQNLIGSVTIPAGSTTATIPINVIDDGLVEGSETAIINLSANTNYNSGTGGNNIDFGDTSGTVTIADNDVSIPNTSWKAEYFNNISLSGTPIFTENLGSGSQGFNKNWGGNSPASSIPVDNFSGRMRTERYFAPGLYQIKVQADDGIRVKVGNESVINRWFDQPFATNSGYFRSNGGTVPITVDYYERTGSAAVNFSITPVTTKFRDSVDLSQQWKSTVYSWNSSQGSAPPTNFWEEDINNPNAIGEINLGRNTRIDGKKGINVNWGQGAPNGDGNRLPHDFFAMRAFTEADFDGSLYKFQVQGDDGFQLLAINQSTGQRYDITSANQWTQAYEAKEFTSQLPAGRYYMHFHQYEGGGDARFDLSWEKAQQQNPILNTQSPQYFRDRPQFYMQQGNGYAQYGYGSSVLGNNSFGQEGNCTWYAYGRLKELGFNPNDIMNNYPSAYDWSPLRNGSRVLSAGETPRLGDVAQWYLNGLNHVAIVEKVENGYVWLSESNWVTDKDGDMDGDGIITGDGTVHKIVQYTVNNPHRYIRLTKT